MSLLFRVGSADETLATHGLSHVVEHLVLHGLQERPYAVNGYTNALETVFYAHGSKEELASFPGDVADMLGNLPLDRLADERGVLLAEEASRRAAYSEQLLERRYGPAGFGLAGHRPLGTEWVDEAIVDSWAHERFNRQTAVLALTFRPPKQLRVGLPGGQGSTCPFPEPLPTVVYPAYIEEGPNGIALSGIVEASEAVLVAGQCDQAARLQGVARSWALLRGLGIFNHPRPPIGPRLRDRGLPTCRRDCGSRRTPWRAR